MRDSGRFSERDARQTVVVDAVARFAIRAAATARRAHGAQRLLRAVVATPSTDAVVVNAFDITSNRARGTVGLFQRTVTRVEVQVAIARAQSAQTSRRDARETVGELAAAAADADVRRAPVVVDARASIRAVRLAAAAVEVPVRGAVGAAAVSRRAGRARRVGAALAVDADVGLAPVVVAAGGSAR